MVLKRIEKDGKIDAVYESSNILSSMYDKASKDLIITFNKGARYKYPLVELTDYTRFELADSQGVVFNSHIKKYSFEKLEPVDVYAITEEINALRVEEKKIFLKVKQKKLMDTVSCLVIENGLGSLTEFNLNKVQGEITDYLAELKKN